MGAIFEYYDMHVSDAVAETETPAKPAATAQ
jgi:hypothetical protein